MRTYSPLAISPASIALLLAACGAAEQPAPQAPRATLEEPAPQAPAPVTAEAIDAGVDAAEPRIVGEDAGPPDLGPIDHRGTPCFPGGALRHASRPERHPAGHFETVIHSSIAFDRLGEARVAPGETVRFEVTIENVGTDELGLSDGDVERLRTLHVLGLSADWTLPIDGPTELHAGQRLAPGAMIRLCATYEVTREPIDTGRPDEPTHTYSLDWPTMHHEGLGARGGYLSTGRRILVVRYPRERGPSVREAESWGGILRVRIADGASLLTIARETVVRIGSSVALFSADEETRTTTRVEEAVLMQAPETMRVADAAALLAARPDVVSATPILRGQPGTEGCSDYSPCGPGQTCCYMCGIEGCPMSCFGGPSCPTDIP